MRAMKQLSSHGFQPFLDQLEAFFHQGVGQPCASDGRALLIEKTFRPATAACEMANQRSDRERGRSRTPTGT